jgi:hypothetical protein
MHTISLSYESALRIIAVHDAASDADRSSHILSGVCLRSVAVQTDVCNGHALIIVATDGKLLLEEQWSLDAGNLEDTEINLGPQAVAQLALWLKSVKATLGKRPSCTMEASWDGKVCTFRVPGLALGECPLRATEGTFPRYDHALRPSDAPSAPERVGYNLAYSASVAKAWKQPKLDCVAVEVKHYRGTVLRLLRLPIGCQSALALIMPISLPA